MTGLEYLWVDLPLISDVFSNIIHFVYILVIWNFKENNNHHPDLLEFGTWT